MNQRSPAYDFGTLVHFREIIIGRLDGIRLSIEHNHNNEPQFLEDLKGCEPTGEKGVEFEKHLILNGQSKKHKNDLEAALERLENGTYGFCQKPGCNSVVPFDRLEAIPQAKYCLPCEVQVKVSKSNGVVTTLRRIVGRRVIIRRTLPEKKTR